MTLDLWNTEESFKLFQPQSIINKLIKKLKFIPNRRRRTRKRRKKQLQNPSMEVFGAVISRPIPSVSGNGTGVEPQRRYAPFSASFLGVSVGIQSNSSASGKSYKVCSLSKSVFPDQSHVDYYSMGRRKIRCRALEEKKKVKGQKDMIKKELKRINVLSRMSSNCDNVLIDHFKDEMISVRLWGLIYLFFCCWSPNCLKNFVLGIWFSVHAYLNFTLNYIIKGILHLITLLYF